MKTKKFFLGLSLLVSIATMISCSSESRDYYEYLDRKTTASEKETLKQIESKIDSINKSEDNLSRAGSLTTDLSGLAINELPKPKKNFNPVTNADLAGAFLGTMFGPWWGLGYAIFFSALECSTSTKVSLANANDISMLPISDNVVYVQNESSPTMIDSIGYYHNLILQDIGVEKLKVADVNDIGVLITGSMSKMFGNNAQDITTSRLMNTELTNFILSYKEQLLNAKNAVEFCNIISKYGNVNEDELSVLQLYMQGKTNTSDSNYTLKVLTSIETSELSDETKNRLRAGILVGNASEQLWLFK